MLSRSLYLILKTRFFCSYSAFYVGKNDDEVFIATKRAARNMSYQGMTAQNGVVRYVEGMETVFHLHYSLLVNSNIALA